MEISAEVRLWWPASQGDRLTIWFAELSDIDPGGSLSLEPGNAGADPRTDVYLCDPAQPDVGVKIRSVWTPHEEVEIKSLIDVRNPELAFGPVTIWVKSGARGLQLDPSRTVATSKFRSLRRYAWDGELLNEVTLDANENALVGGEPTSGCNVELARVEIQGVETCRYTVGFEAFGSLETVEPTLRRCVQHTAGRSPPPALEHAEAASYPLLIARITRAQEQ